MEGKLDDALKWQLELFGLTLLLGSERKKNVVWRKVREIGFLIFFLVHSETGS